MKSQRMKVSQNIDVALSCHFWHGQVVRLDRLQSVSAAAAQTAWLTDRLGALNFTISLQRSLLQSVEGACCDACHKILFCAMAVMNGVSNSSVAFHDVLSRRSKPFDAVWFMVSDGAAEV